LQAATDEATSWWNLLREVSATVEEAAAPTEKIPEAAEEKKEEDRFNKEIMRLEERISQLEDAKRSRQAVKFIVRTCDELKAYDPSKASGLDLVDPDGPFGDDPIPTFCDMATGTTQVSHDAADGAEVDCSGQACFTQNVQYEASYRQLVALTR
jgi:Fibrillar collagen C-terminal domain